MRQIGVDDKTTKRKYKIVHILQDILYIGLVLNLGHIISMS